MNTVIVNEESQKKPFMGNLNKINKILIIDIIVLIVVLIILLNTIEMLYGLFCYDKIYKGIYVNDIYAGGMTKEMLKDSLTKEYEGIAKNGKIEIKCLEHKVVVNFSEIDLSYDIESTVDEAFMVGRSGSFFKKAGQILILAWSRKVLPIKTKFNIEKLKNVINTVNEKVSISAKEPDLLIQEDLQKVTLRNGKSGKGIDVDEVISILKKNIEGKVFDSIEVKVKIYLPNKIDRQKFFELLNCEPQNAYPEVVDGKVNIVPEVYGKKIDRNKFDACISEIENSEGAEKVLPVIFSKPSVCMEDVKNKLFCDLLGSMTTSFETSTWQRAENIKIAASKINGKIIGKNDEFSFNNVVGPRTADGGFQVANTFIGKKVVPDFGGGVCQVSTTLFNAAIYADLEITERTNHTFEVPYVEVGRDAAVSYDGPDLKFKNNTNWPIKIIASVSGSSITCSILGTKENYGRTVEYYSVRTGKFMPTVNVKYDSNLPEGTEEVISEGIPGGTAETYKVVKQDGKVIEEKVAFYSKYEAKPKEILKGTKPKISQGAKPQNSQNAEH